MYLRTLRPDPTKAETKRAERRYFNFIPGGVAEASLIFPETPTFYQNYLAIMSNTADVTGGKPIAV
jgi:hypothetical protein